MACFVALEILLSFLVTPFMFDQNVDFLQDRPGGPWEQRDGHEVVRNRIVIDFAMIMGLSFESFRDLKFRFVFGLVSRSLF